MLRHCFSENIMKVVSDNVMAGLQIHLHFSCNFPSLCVEISLVQSSHIVGKWLVTVGMLDYNSFTHNLAGFLYSYFKMSEGEAV